MTLLGGSEVNNPPVKQETQVRFLGWEDPLEKEIATHSSVLAWDIPWTEEPGGLQSTGLQRAGHDLVTKEQQQVGFPGGSDGQESACSAGDPGSIPGLGISPGEGESYHFSILAWRIPWTEEPGGLQSMGSQSQTQLRD